MSYDKQEISSYDFLEQNFTEALINDFEFKEVKQLANIEFEVFGS